MFGGNGFGFDVGSLLGALAGGKSGSNDDNGFGGNGWWALIIILALFGYGGNGGLFGGNRGGGETTVVDAAMQRGFDTQAIVSKLDGINNGICSLGYDQLSQINGINTNILQTGFGITGAIQANAIAAMQQSNALQALLQSCCCDLKSLFAQADYNRASDTCAITTAIDRVGDRIVANDNNNFRALYDQQVALQMEALRQRNSELERRLTMCDTQNMITASSNYVVNKLNPTPIPSYTVSNPNGCGCGNYQNTCGWGNNGFAPFWNFN